MNVALLACVFWFFTASAHAAISDSYPHDVGIASDPAVVFSENFESAEATFSARFNGGSASGIDVSTDVPGLSGGVQSLVLIPDVIAGQIYTQLPSDYSELYLRYYVKYLGNVSHHAGGYMGGYESHSSYPQGDAGVKDGDRFISSLEQQGGDPKTYLGTYNNFVGMQGSDDGAGNYYGRDYLVTEAPALNLNTWQCVEMRVKVNSTAGNSDGEFQLWVDDTQIQNFIPGSPVGAYNGVGTWTTGAGSAFPGLQWRDRLTYAINWIKLQNYSDVGTPYNVRFDDLVVATQRIGCLSTTGGSPNSTINGGARFTGSLRLIDLDESTQAEVIRP